MPHPTPLIGTLENQPKAPCKFRQYPRKNENHLESHILHTLPFVVVRSQHVIDLQKHRQAFSAVDWFSCFSFQLGTALEARA